MKEYQNELREISNKLQNIEYENLASTVALIGLYNRHKFTQRGEEFIILLPTVDLQGAILIAKKIQKTVCEVKIDKVRNISASFGISEVREGEDTI